MPSTSFRHRVDGVAHGLPPAFTAYDESVTPLQQHQQQPLRRRGGPVPAPPSLLSAKSSVTRSFQSTPVENPYESTPTSTSASSGGTVATSPPPHQHQQSRSQRSHCRTTDGYTPVTTTTVTSTPLQSSSPSTTASSSASAPAGRSQHRGHSNGTHSSTPSVTAVHTQLDTTSSPTRANQTALPNPRTPMPKKLNAAPRSLSRRARDKWSCNPTPKERLRSSEGGVGERPRVSPSSGHSFTPLQPSPTENAAAAATFASTALDAPLIVHASIPAAASPSSLRSLNEIDQQQRGSATRGGSTAHQRNPNSTAAVSRSGGSGSHSHWSRSSTTTTCHSSALLPHMRQETGVPSPSPEVTNPPSTSTTPTDKVVTAGPTVMSNAERRKAEHGARKQLRASIYNGNIKVHGYVAQTAYAQKNPFRQQDFAEFAANPKYQPPAGFDIYSQAMATRVYGLEVSRASQGEFMMQRLVNAARPATVEERAEVEALLSSTLERLQVGDWFYKWTRINHVHQRYVWLNLQRGTLMWSLSPKESVVLNAEIKLSTVTSILPDCLQLEAPMRVFYRMTINTPDRCVSLATEIRKKFDVWYRVLFQLTAPNLVHGVPGVWGRPSGSVNTTGRGAASRWASRFSPLDAVTEDTTGHLSHDQLYTQGVLSSSD